MVRNVLCIVCSGEVGDQDLVPLAGGGGRLGGCSGRSLLVSAVIHQSSGDMGAEAIHSRTVLSGTPDVPWRTSGIDTISRIALSRSRSRRGSPL